MSAPPFVSTPPRGVAGWLARLDDRELPVLAGTAEALVELAAIEDAVDAHMLAPTVQGDPLMLLKLLAHVARLRAGRDGSGPETATEALVMLGIPPFFRTFAGLPSVEERLAPVPEALVGFREVLRRSRRAANFAIGFAVHRMDHDAGLIHEAALLHDFAEMLLWIHAPALALEIARRQAIDPALRSAQAQRDVLGLPLAELQHALLMAWRLPALLVQITDDTQAGSNPQLHNVQLAIRVARHSARGWDNPALPDDVRELADFLHLAPDAVQRLLHDIDAD